MVAMTTIVDRKQLGDSKEILTVNGVGSLPRWFIAKHLLWTIFENWKLIRWTSMTLLLVRKLYHRHNQRSRHDILTISTNRVISSGRLKPTTTRNATAFEFWIDSFQTIVLLHCDVFEKTFDRRLMCVLMNRWNSINSVVVSELALQWLAFAAFSHFSSGN